MRRSRRTITAQRTIWNQVLSIDSSSVGTTSIRRRRAYRVLLLPLLELLFQQARGFLTDRRCSLHTCNLKPMPELLINTDIEQVLREKKSSTLRCMLDGIKELQGRVDTWNKFASSVSITSA